MRRLDGSVSLFHRLPHGGHVDLNLSSDGRVCLLVNSSAHVSEVLHELDTVRAELQQFHLAQVGESRPTAIAFVGGAAA